MDAFPMKAPLLLSLSLLVLLGACDQLGIPNPAKNEIRQEADGKAIGSACRHAGRAIEDCYTLNQGASKAAMFAGWKEMNDYMVENKIAEVAPQLASGVLSGPSFAQEVARAQPTALVAASRHASVRDALVQAFHGPSLRVYASEDIVGVEVGGAVKNVLAIATGLCDGLQLGLNARAALITRGLAEMTRLGLALGARTDTFMGLSGLGDLVLTATGDLSRNRRVGLLLADGKSLQQAVDSLGHVAEGVYSARTVVQRARAAGVEMPIAECVVALLDGRLHAADAVARLMEREPTVERR